MHSFEIFWFNGLPAFFIIVLTTFQGVFAAPLECKLTRKGREYVGYKSTTVSGRTCQRWDQHVPHRHYVVGHAMPEMSLTAAENYCRNPGYGRADPWCYTTDPQVVWEYCNIPYCVEKILNASIPDAKCVATKGKCGEKRCCVHDDYVTGFCDGDVSRVCCLGEYDCNWDGNKFPPASGECLSDPRGKLYRGRQSKTVDGHLCQRWDAQYPNRHDTEGVGSKDYNYCRNKYLYGEEDDKVSPWCNTMENSTEWQLCSIPICAGVTEQTYYDPKPQKDDRLCDLASGTCGTSWCCANGHYSDDLCSGGAERKCCFSWFDCKWKEHKEKEIPIIWPDGDYAIPMSVYACPDHIRKFWEAGSATLSAFSNTIHWPAEFHLRGSFTKTEMKIRVCVSTSSQPSSTGLVPGSGQKVQAVNWPRGSYCVLGLNNTCPSGFKSDAIKLPLRPMEVFGLASVIFDNDTDAVTLRLCCREDGPKETAVKLPPYFSFYLISAAPRCQKVINMTVTLQYIQIHATDSSTYNTTIWLCFYEPVRIDTCYKEVDAGWDYRGGINVTHKGPCQPWRLFRSIEWSLFLDYAGIAGDTNNCRWTYFSLEPVPWCFANNYRIQCGVPKCNSSSYERYENAAFRKPATQMDANTEMAQLVVDLSSGTCSNQENVHKPWWQVDLRDIYEVHAVQINRQYISCPLRLFDVYVSIYPDDFLLEGQSFLCRRNFSAGTAYTVVAECIQSIKGQFVTIVNLAHVETDLRVDFKVKSCFQICDVKVFANATKCGLALSTASGASLPTEQYEASSSELGFGVEYAGLFSKNSWCAKSTDKNRFIEVDLLKTREITGILTQGNNGEREAFVTSFTVAHSSNSPTNLKVYEQSPGVTQIFRRVKRRNEPERHMFMQSFKARYIRLTILEYVLAPCLRFELLGCISSEETNLSNEISTQTQLNAPNFPRYYGQDRRFRWTVKAKPGTFAQVHFVQAHVAPREEPWKEGTFTINTGMCQDNLTISYGDHTAPMVVNGEAVFLSSGDQLEIELSACHRYRIPINDGPHSHFGFNATTLFSDCPGCSVQGQCLGTTVCATECGHLVSPNFPSFYPVNTKCTWEIRVDVGKYVALEFLTFDIFEEALTTCQVDYLEIFDFDYTGTKRTSIGRYCNSNLPPKLILSSWDRLALELMTNFKDQRPGFHAKYKSLSYALPTGGNTTNVDECPPNWLYHDNSCYDVIQSNESSVTWLMARDRCRTSTADLVSINSQAEMEFIHFTLTTLTRRQDNRFYIGLSDRENEGRWMWEDRSPVTFSAWSVSGDFAQPDGSETEDCTMILLENIYSFNQWHDIPCSYNKVNQYICEKPSRSAWQDPTSLVAAREAFFKTSCPSQWFQCAESKECINKEFVCDGINDCFDGSDETNCSLPCPEVTFQCTNSRCISLNLYCNFQDNCGDGSDEETCVPQMCANDEFKCNNGECIPSTKRCDLNKDCKDGTDEENCVSCQPDVAYQCYDGTCIPKKTRCDSRIDCPGSFREDESLGCATETRQTCADWRRDGYVTNGSHVINPGSFGAFQVECEMHEGHVVTIVHHNTAARTEVHGYEEYLSYVRNVTYYHVTKKQLSALKSLSTKCEQYMKLECFSASTVDNRNGWYDINGEIHLYSGDNPRFPKCKCWLDKACQDKRELCWCTTNLDGFEWFMDEGYMRNKTILPITAFTLSDTGDQKEYVYHTIGPLRCYQGIDEEVQKFKCKNGQPIGREQLCKSHKDKQGNDLGCRDRSHLEKCESAVCTGDGNVKCPQSYCIPIGSICDDVWDCPRGEDEIDCDNTTCPGMYKCRGGRNCIEWQQVCNGERDCQHGDDEVNCFLSCPDECSCNTLTYICRERDLTSLPLNISAQARKLDLSRNEMVLEENSFSDFWWLGELNLSSNRLKTLTPKLFVNLKNLYSLDLSFNDFTELVPETFVGLGKLKHLFLHGNHRLSTFSPGTFQGLDSLPKLHLSKFSIKGLRRDLFVGLKSLETLILSENQIESIEGGSFNGLERLKLLNMSGNPIETFSITMFNNLNSLEFLQTDDFSFCCLVRDQLPEENCLPPKDEISSCDDLMRDNLLRTSLWVLGFFAFFGNAFVFVWRFFNKEGNAIHGLFVQHLALSDFLMGTYLLGLGAADVHFRGRYIENAKSWRKSWICNALGAIATISSETSVFMLCSITTDRFVNIVFPFGTKRLNKKRAYGVLTVVWALAILIACVPLLPTDYFAGQFYSRAGVCVSLHITRETPPGWEFSVAIFHGLNLSAFLYIAVAYGWMFKVIRETGTAAGTKEKQAEIAAARKMTLIVLTDFMCWVPINIMGFIAMAGGSIPGDVYAWTVVLLLPINSAINPILYTISSMKLRKREKKLQRAKTALARETSLSISDTDQQLTNVTALMVDCGPTQRRVSLTRLLNTKMLSMRDVLYSLREVTQAVVNLHKMSLCVGALDTDDIRICLSGSSKPPSVWLAAKPRAALSEFQYANDVDELRKMITKILRVRAKA